MMFLQSAVTPAPVPAPFLRAMSLGQQTVRHALDTLRFDPSPYGMRRAFELVNGVPKAIDAYTTMATWVPEREQRIADAGIMALRTARSLLQGSWDVVNAKTQLRAAYYNFTLAKGERLEDLWEDKWK